MKQFIFLLSSILITLFGNSQTQLWGVNNSGGQTEAGNIFKTDGSGNNLVVQHNFFKYDGFTPGENGSLIEGINGKLYGLSILGGLNGAGIIFQFIPSTNQYTKLFDFNDIASGKYPSGSLLQATDGKLYGMTSAGGTNDMGVLFQFDPITNVFSKKINFSGASNGSKPYGTLMQASDGMIYGMTSAGGAFGGGVIFQYNPVTNSYSKKYDFTSSAGFSPYGSLIEAYDGKFYGLAINGGVNGNGTLFQYDPLTNIYTKKVDFSATVNGKNPYGTLLQTADSMLYGITANGGLNGYGVLFKYNIATNTIVKKHDFTGSIGSATGQQPHGALIQASNGLLYGLSSSGGVNGSGTLFQYDINTSILTVKQHLSVANGYQPWGPLLQASDGKLYGFTNSGGLTNWGFLFQYDPLIDLYTNKINFDAAIDGKQPSGPLTLASDNMFYGTTSAGGVNDLGVLFQFNPFNQTYIKKIDFAATSNGISPNGRMIQASNGKIYGVTNTGGIGGYGVLFEYDNVVNSYTKKVEFNGSNGREPYGGVIQANDGKLYGMTSKGGANNMGILFQYDILTDTYVKKIDFTGTVNGSSPKGALLQASDGKLYGFTEMGGVYGDGTLFQYDPTTSVLTKLIDIKGNLHGSHPGGSLIQANDGNIYGMTSVNVNNDGALLQFNPISMVFGAKFYFDRYTIGTGSCGDLLQASDGNLYMLGGGGANNFGTLVQYNIGSNTVVKKMDFSGTNGRVIIAGNSPSLTEVPLMIATSTLSLIHCAGSSFKVPFVVSDNFGIGNMFTLQLSDASGSFTSPVNIGSINSIASDSIIANIPSFAAQGNAYRIRVVSSNPIIVGSDNGANITINSCSDVWPGDANSDGASDNLDVLELGLHYTQTGPSRTSVSNNWQGYSAVNWVGTISNGKNLYHSDCNGDGIINDDDTLAIYNNYGLTHTFKPAQTTTVNPQLSIVPDQSMVVKGTWGTASIYFGDATTTINNINGIAFTVDFDNALIEPNSIWIEYQNSFIDAGQNLYFRKLDFANSKLYTASTHTVSSNVNGFGKIATLHYQILSSLATDQVLNIGISQANQSNASGNITPLTTGTGTLMAIGASVGVKENSFNGNILITPNPTYGLLNISFNTIPQNTKIELYNSIGALVLTEVMSDKNNTINASELSNGIYFMKVVENNKVVAVKKVVRE